MCHHVQLPVQLAIGAVLQSVPDCLLNSIRLGRFYFPDPGPDVCSEGCRRIGLCSDPERKFERQRVATQLLIRWHEWQRRYVQRVQASLDELGPSKLADFDLPETPLPPAQRTPQKSHTVTYDHQIEAWKEILPPSGLRTPTTRRQAASSAHGRTSLSPATEAEIASAELLGGDGYADKSRQEPDGHDDRALEQPTSQYFAKSNSQKLRTATVNLDSVCQDATGSEAGRDNGYQASHHRSRVSGIATSNVHVSADTNDDNDFEDPNKWPRNNFSKPSRAPSRVFSSKRKHDDDLSLVKAEHIAQVAAGVGGAGRFYSNRDRNHSSATLPTASLSSQHDLFSDETQPESPDIG